MCPLVTGARGYGMSCAISMSPLRLILRAGWQTARVALPRTLPSFVEIARNLLLFLSFCVSVFRRP
jgi:hypothetical protein